MVLAKGAMGEEPAYPHLELLEKGIDWFDEIFRVASVRDYQIGLNGGAENVSYNLSVGFFQQKGMNIIGSRCGRITNTAPGKK